MINSVLKKQKGAIILMFLVFLPIMLAFVGLVIDFGYMYAEKTKLQNAADAAALSGVTYLKSGEETITEHVAGMLRGNSFTPTDRAASDENLSKDANWKIRYEKNKQLQDPVIVVDKPMDADRLRVSLFKTIKLIFLPIVSNDLATVDLTTTAVAENSNPSSPAPAPKARSANVRAKSKLPIEEEFIFIVSEKLSIGKAGNGNYFNIPSPRVFNDLSATSSDTDIYKYNDYNKMLTQSIYANSMTVASGSQLRIGDGGIFYTNSKTSLKPSATVLVDKNSLYDEFLVRDTSTDISTDSTKISEVKGFISTTHTKGEAEFTKILNNSNAIKIPVTEKYFVLTNEKLQATGKVDQSGNVDSPVVIYVDDSYWQKNPKGPVPTVYMQISSTNIATIEGGGYYDKTYIYNFHQPVVAKGVDLVISSRFFEPLDLGYQIEEYTKYSDIYSLADDSDRGGNLTIATKITIKSEIINGIEKFSIIDRADSNGYPYDFVKEFFGIIYSNNDLTVEGFDNNKRMLFHKALIAKNLLFSIARGFRVDASHKFELLPVANKLRLVE